jgi:hypothetical protein
MCCANIVLHELEDLGRSRGGILASSGERPSPSPWTMDLQMVDFSCLRTTRDNSRPHNRTYSCCFTVINTLKKGKCWWTGHRGSLVVQPIIADALPYMGVMGREKTSVCFLRLRERTPIRQNKMSQPFGLPFPPCSKWDYFNSASSLLGGVEFMQIMAL